MGKEPCKVRGRDLLGFYEIKIILKEGNEGNVSKNVANSRIKRWRKVVNCNHSHQLRDTNGGGT